MKLFPLALLSVQACAFSFAPAKTRLSTNLMVAEAGDYSPLEFENKINLKVDLDSPKVVTTDSIEKGKKVYCRCWLSSTFPMCDGTHQKHNEAMGDNVGPLIVSVAKE